MPTFNAEQLHQIATRILQAAGASPQEAQVVAEELVEANRVGHDSHGVMRLKQYVEYIEQGILKPGGQVRVIEEQPALALIDGGSNFGQVVARRAVELACDRARRVGTFSVWCRNTNHVGRLGSYTRRVALQGLAALMAVSAPGGGGVVPWGGRQRRLGTNPISMAAPREPEPIVLDMTTAATAEGKLRVAAQKGDSVPPGWLVDADGNPSTDPNDYYRGGAILPLGGPMGFKGYGLGAMLDIFCGILSGFGIGRPDLPPGANSVWLYVVDIRKIVSPADYNQWMTKYQSWIKDCPKSPGVEQILLPGEIETQRRAVRDTQGISVPDETWRQTCQVAAKLGVSLDQFSR